MDEPEAYVRTVLVNTYAKWWRRKWNGEIPAGKLLRALARLPRGQRTVVGMEPSASGYLLRPAG